MSHAHRERNLRRRQTNAIRACLCIDCDPQGGGMGKRPFCKLRNELDGYRWRVESLSPSEVSILLDELGEGLSEFEA